MPCTAEDIAELDALKADYKAVRTAIRAILTGAQSYSLDTSQTRQSVSRANLSELRIMAETLRAEILALESQLGLGRGTIRVVPSW